MEGFGGVPIPFILDWRNARTAGEMQVITLPVGPVGPDYLRSGNLRVMFPGSVDSDDPPPLE